MEEIILNNLHLKKDANDLLDAAFYHNSIVNPILIHFIDLINKFKINLFSTYYNLHDVRMLSFLNRSVQASLHMMNNSDLRTHYPEIYRKYLSTLAFTPFSISHYEYDMIHQLLTNPAIAYYENFDPLLRYFRESVVNYESPYNYHNNPAY